MSGADITPLDTEVARVKLGLMLRALRKNRSLTGTALAKRANVSQSYLSKIETGAIQVDERLVTALLHALNADPQDTQRVLVQYRLTQIDPNSYRFISGHGVSLKQAEIRERIRMARQARVLEIFIIPGLLQVAAYAEQIFRAYCLNEDDVASSLRERMNSQAVLLQNGRSLKFIIFENGVRSQITSREQHLEQLDYVARVSTRSNVSVRIVPVSASVPLYLCNSFMILDESYVTAETNIGEQTSTDPQEVREYLQIFKSVESVSLDQGNSRGLVYSIIDELASRH